MPANERDIKRKIVQRHTLSQQINGLQDDLKQLNNEILKGMQEDGVEEIEIVGKNKFNPKSLKCTIISKIDIIFDLDKLKKKIKKDTCSKIIDKKYVIKDWQQMKSFIEGVIISANTGSNNFDRKEFIKKFVSMIEVEEKLNKDMLEQLESIGEISKEDLAGTYEAKVGNSYIRIQEQSKK